jgi:hypothetical protein
MVSPIVVATEPRHEQATARRMLMPLQKRQVFLLRSSGPMMFDLKAHSPIEAPHNYRSAYGLNPQGCPIILRHLLQIIFEAPVTWRSESLCKQVKTTFRRPVVGPQKVSIQFGRLIK